MAVDIVFCIAYCIACTHAIMNKLNGLLGAVGLVMYLYCMAKIMGLVWLTNVYLSRILQQYGV